MKQLFQHDHIFSATGTDVSRLCSTGDVAAFNHAYDVRFTGGPSTVSLFIETSINNADWSTLGAEVTAAITTQAADVLARYVRFRLVTLTGGTTPTIVIKYMGASA